MGKKLFSNGKKKSFGSSAPTYVGKGMRIEGKIWGVRPIWIDGEVLGTIDIESEVVIGENAKIDATIRASSIKVNGFVEGELYGSSRIEIMSKGRVRGKVTNLAGCLVIQDGGVVEGQCTIVTEEKMKGLLPQKYAKLLPEKTDFQIKDVKNNENEDESIKKND